MRVEWIEEAVAQFRIAWLWRTFSDRFQSAPWQALPRTLREISASMLRSEWVPGLAEAVEHWSIPIDGSLPDEAGVVRFVERMREGRGLDARQPESLSNWLENCRRNAAENSIVAPAKPLGSDWESLGPPASVRVRLWLAEADALAQWQELVSRWNRRSRGDNLKKDGASLHGECNELIEQIRQTQGGWKLFGKSREAKLLQEAGELLSVCRDRLGGTVSTESTLDFDAQFNELQRRVAAVLSDCSAAWPPLRMLELGKEPGHVDREAPVVKKPTVAVGTRKEPVSHPPPPRFDRAGKRLESPLLAKVFEKAAAGGDPLKNVGGKIRAAFQEWLQTSGGDWFHELAQTATYRNAPESAASRVWLSLLLQAKWCECYPPIDPATNLPLPAEKGTVGEVRWNFAAAQPPGGVVSVERFAPTPQGARYTLSQGVEVPESPLGAAVQLQKMASSDPGWAELREPIEQMVAASRQSILRTTEVESPAQWLGNVLQLLPRLFASPPASEGSGSSEPHLGVAQGAEFLKLLRLWGAAFQLEILPRNWNFETLIPYDDLAADERSNPVFVFRTDEPRGMVYRIRSFGLQHADGTAIQPASVLVSCGVAPAGFTDLFKSLPEPGTPATVPIGQRLQEWREAALKGILENTMIRFFVEYWGPLGEPLRQSDPPLATSFGDHLHEILEKAIGVKPFYPERFQEYDPEWLELASQRGVVSGRVRRVLRPGLQDAQHRLRVPALVEVE